ncbi:hypothetical protein [Terracoccus sp. 273MFTsu3.1]|nr:hypothetical protein [Terracoccus sp. 273MFTsu3.1]
MFPRIKRQHRRYCPRYRSIFRRCICNKTPARPFEIHPNWHERLPIEEDR